MSIVGSCSASSFLVSTGLAFFFFYSAEGSATSASLFCFFSLRVARTKAPSAHLWTSFIFVINVGKLKVWPCSSISALLSSNILSKAASIYSFVTVTPTPVAASNSCWFTLKSAPWVLIFSSNHLVASSICYTLVHLLSTTIYTNEGRCTC